jgi:4-hydroxybenzoate polyprenyltransferase
MTASAAVLKYARLARPDHWVKNAFVAPGSVFAWVLVTGAVTPGGVGRAVLAIAATCPIASANYVINEWLDAASDRFHPVKKDRVAVTQGVSARAAMIEYGLLAAVGLALAAPLGRLFVVLEAALLVMGLVYNVRPVRSKDVPYLDVLSESVNNAIRLGLGWFAVAPDWLPPASLVFGYWMGGAFLMGVKRFAEYRMIGDPERAGAYRRSFRHYTEASLLASSLLYGLLSVFFTGVFLVKYRIELVLFVPLLCGLFAQYLGLSYRADSVVQKPEKLYRERGLMAYVAVLVAVFAVLLAVRLEWLDALADPALLRTGPFGGGR